jgi:eukaryotic-like serine/threonine-protein kinase
MAIAAGTRLGPYEILSPIGAGGMGEVYKAKDTRLDRIVAIKVLPSHLSENPQLKQRLEREARAISSLSHPHICALYDIGSQNGIEYLVMEYLEGETLARRLDKGAFPAEQVLRYGIQIAEALQKAHRQGITHRDLKPGNIIITKSGAKLLDFGLAKYQVESEQSNSSKLETRDRRLTEEGTMLGTVQYMAPEQLEAKEADARTDIFALGEILYEMATGQFAFKGNSKAQLIASILSTEPRPVSAIQPLLPPALDHIVKKCLSKDPEDRWQNAQDVASELKWVSEQISQGQTSPALSPPAFKIRTASVITGILILTTVLFAAIAVYFYKAAQEKPVLRVLVLPEVNTTMSQAGSVAVSPNGKLVAFVALAEGGINSIYLRPFDALQARRITGTDDATFPFWSPDSKMIGFFAQGKLKRVDVLGGPVQNLCDATAGRGATWNNDGTILFSPSLGDGIYRVSASGGTATPITALNESLGESTHRWPYVLPDGDHFLFSVQSIKPETTGFYVESLISKKRKKILPDLTRAEYSADGYLVFVREKNLVAQKFDLKKLEVSGEAFPLAEDLYTEPGAGTASFSVSKNGILAYAATSGYGSQQLVWMDRSGNSLGSLGESGILGDPWLSPDEKRLAIYMNRGSSRPDIYIVDLTQNIFTRFTFDPSNDFNPTWSPDGSHVAFSSSRSGPYNIYSKEVGGSAEEKLLFASPDWKFVSDWTKDGRYIVFENDSAKTKADVFLLPMVGSRKPFPYLQTEFNEAHANVSPDGKWIAYGCDETGRSEIYVQSFPSPGSKRQVSTSGGTQPRWSLDQKELFYLASDGMLMSVEVRVTPNFEAGVPRPLFNTHVPSIPLIGNDRNQYFVSTDGQRFLVNRIAADTLTTPITVIFNWSKLLTK